MWTIVPVSSELGWELVLVSASALGWELVLVLELELVSVLVLE